MAQRDIDNLSRVHTGEFGISIGASQYFGDLHPQLLPSHPNTAVGIFYRRQLNNYVSAKLSANYIFLSYSDSYSSNMVQRYRNLNFSTNVWEATVSGDFNFFKFNPFDLGAHRWTPYISLGLGIFSFAPYTYFSGTKYFLRDIGTEGQGTAGHPPLYSRVAMCFPVGLGAKVAINDYVNFFAELNYRFTTTNYLDDVAGNYDAAAFQKVPDVATYPIGYYLQDRSYELGTRLGGTPEQPINRQRGNGGSSDSYMTLQFGISFNFENYICPSAAKSR